MGVDFCNDTILEELNSLLSPTEDDIKTIEPWYTYLCPVIIFICFFSIIFNGLLLSISRQSRDLTPVALLSLNLAVTDLFASTLNGLGILLNSYLPIVWKIETPLCYMLIFEVFRSAALVASALHLLALAFVHYRGIVNPLHYRSTILFSKHLSRTINMISAVCWIIPLTIMTLWFWCIPCQGFQPKGCSHFFTISFSFRYMILTLFAFPLLVMSVIYLRIFIIISRLQKSKGNADKLSHEHSTLTRGAISAAGPLVTAAHVNLPELIARGEKGPSMGRCAACAARALQQQAQANGDGNGLPDDEQTAGEFTISILSEASIEEDNLVAAAGAATGAATTSTDCSAQTAVVGGNQVSTFGKLLQAAGGDGLAVEGSALDLAEDGNDGPSGSSGSGSRSSSSASSSRSVSGSGSSGGSQVSSSISANNRQRHSTSKCEPKVTPTRKTSDERRDEGRLRSGLGAGDYSNGRSSRGQRAQLKSQVSRQEGGCSNDGEHRVSLLAAESERPDERVTLATTKGDCDKDGEGKLELGKLLADSQTTTTSDKLPRTGARGLIFVFKRMILPRAGVDCARDTGGGGQPATALAFIAAKPDSDHDSSTAPVAINGSEQYQSGGNRRNKRPVEGTNGQSFEAELMNSTNSERVNPVSAKLAKPSNGLRQADGDGEHYAAADSNEEPLIGTNDQIDRGKSAFFASSLANSLDTSGCSTKTNDSKRKFPGKTQFCLSPKTDSDVASTSSSRGLKLANSTATSVVDSGETSTKSPIQLHGGPKSRLLLGGLRRQQSNPGTTDGSSPLAPPTWECTCDNKLGRFNPKLARSNTISGGNRVTKGFGRRKPEVAEGHESGRVATAAALISQVSTDQVVSKISSATVAVNSLAQAGASDLDGPQPFDTAQLTDASDPRKFNARRKRQLHPSSRVKDKNNNSSDAVTNAIHSSTYEPQRKHFHVAANPQTKTKAIVTTLLILGTYFASYIPAIVFQVLTCVEYCPYPLHTIEFLQRIKLGAITNILLIAKSIIDPFIYSYRMNEIQVAINRYLSKRRSKASVANSTHHASQRYTTNKSFRSSNYYQHNSSINHHSHHFHHQLHRHQHQHPVTTAGTTTTTSTTSPNYNNNNNIQTDGHKNQQRLNSNIDSKNSSFVIHQGVDNLTDKILSPNVNNNEATF